MASILCMDDAFGPVEDAIWWLKGFSAAQNNEADRQAIDAMAENLRDVRHFLNSLMHGECNFVSKSAIVTTPALIEDLADIIRRPELFTAEQAAPIIAAARRSIKAHDARNFKISHRYESPPF